MPDAAPTNRTMRVQSAAACILLMLGAIVLSALLWIWSESLPLEGGGGSSFGCYHVGRDSTGKLVLDMQVPPASQLVGDYYFEYSETDSGGPWLVQSLFRAWNVQFRYVTRDASGTLAPTELRLIDRLVRNDMRSNPRTDSLFEPGRQQLLLSGELTRREIRREAIMPYAARAASLLCLMGACVLGVLAGLHGRYLKRIRRGFCGSCGYDMRGIESVQCPECGRRNT
jgi:hypothetical protein